MLAGTRYKKNIIVPCPQKYAVHHNTMSRMSRSKKGGWIGESSRRDEIDGCYQRCHQ